MKNLIIALSLFIVSFSNVYSQDSTTKLLNIFLDCSGCSDDYFKTNMPFASFVRDMNDAEVRIQVFTQYTGGSGTEYTIDFSGQKQFSGLKDTIVYIADREMTADLRREKLLSKITIGLMRFIAKMPLSNDVKITFNKMPDKIVNEVEDPWDRWVFSLSLSSNMSGVKSSNSLSLWSDVSASRTTEDLRNSFSFSNSYSENNYSYESNSIKTVSLSRSFSADIVKSLSSNWSLGGWFYYNTSKYSNIDSKFSFAPGIEYNFFPYSESARHQLRLNYMIYSNFNKYTYETIYLKTKETLFSENLSLSFSMIEPWGNVSTSVTARNYFHDFSKNYFNFYTSFGIRLFKGFSMNAYGSYSFIHDQLSLPNTSTSRDDLLTSRKELETNFSYYFSFGFSYTFGSDFSNVVNPRFGG